MIVNGYKIEPGANLRGANLEGANLSDANLRGANLQGANLRGANLEGANCKFANFIYANFRDANLRGVNFEYAFLDYADFTGADLSGAKLHGTTLTKAQIASLASSPAGKVGTKNILRTFLAKIDFKIDAEAKETPENRDRIIARLEQLSADVAHLAGTSKEETPAKTILAAIEVSDLTLQIMELVSDAVLDCADME